MRSNFQVGLYVSDTKALLAQTPPLSNFLDKTKKEIFRSGGDSVRTQAESSLNTPPMPMAGIETGADQDNDGICFVSTAEN